MKALMLVLQESRSAPTGPTRNGLILRVAVVAYYF